MPDPITPLPTPPSTSDPVNFATEADAFLGALPTFGDELNEFAASLNTVATNTTSTSSIAIGTGTKNFTVQTGKSLFEGMSYRMAADNNNWMNGEIISYDSGTGALSLDVDVAVGSGTFADWTGFTSFNGTIQTAQIDNLAITEAKLAVALLRLLTKKKLNNTDASVGSNALSSVVNPGTWDFRSTTLTDGTPVERTLAAADTLVVPNGATLGGTSGQSMRIAQLLIDNGGVLEQALVNLAGGNNLDESTLINTTAMTTGSDSANVIYSASARTGVAFRVVGMLDVVAGAAGAWPNNPTLVQPSGGQAFGALAGFGFGQTWQDMAGSRALTTSYTNTTGKPITVIGSVNNAGGASSLTVTVDGLTLSAVTLAAGGATGFNFIVPHGKSYSITAGGTPSITQWKELR